MRPKSMFIDSNSCLGRGHCPVCRDLEGGRSWRVGLTKHFALGEGAPDFACPHGKPWGYMPSEADLAAAAIERRGRAAISDDVRRIGSECQRCIADRDDPAITDERADHADVCEFLKLCPATRRNRIKSATADCHAGRWTL